MGKDRNVTPILTLTVWCRRPGERTTIAGERRWAPETLEEFTAELQALVGGIDAPAYPVYAACDLGTAACGNGAPASVEHEDERVWAARYLWRSTSPLARAC